ncbi:MAG: hypothetical protein IJW86_10440 [Clostridia bacterium]|nr:hypothetical protein [Clostridia bacterium]
MIDGNATEFIDKLSYEDHYVVFQGKKFFLNGCQAKKDEKGNVISVTLEVYDLTDNKTVFSATKSSAFECIKAFEKANIWDNKTFWKAESEIECIDC